MLIKILFYYLFGYLNITIEGFFIERFMLKRICFLFLILLYYVILFLKSKYFQNF